jgi:hypothetical protein
MTLRGFLREVNAAQKRAARANERQARLHARALKLQAKADEIERAAAEVEEFEERVKQLTSIHHDVGEPMDWAEIRDRPAPASPQRTSRWEDAATQERDKFKPGFWQRILGKEASLREELERQIVAARNRDDVSYQGALKLHRQQLEQWQELHQLATAILSGQVDAYRRAIEELEPLSELQEIGCGLEISFPDGLTAEIDLVVESEKVVPREAKSLTRSGKLSTKAIPQGKFQELYQDYVCGCALRCAREFFSFLPLQRVVVNVQATLLDSASGHSKLQTILTVAIPRATLEGMNFTAADPSDSMKLFPHRMGFKRSQGFFPIQPLMPEEYPKTS